MDDMPERIDSKFRFVLLSAARAEKMIQGAAPKIETDNPKVTRVAMKEILTDAVEWDYGPPPEPEVEQDAVEAEAEEATGEGQE